MDEIKKKATVGIVTWYGPGNYGTGLQAVALSQYLQILGYETFFILDCRSVGNDKESVNKLKEKISYSFKKAKKLFSYKWHKKRKYRKKMLIKEDMQHRFMEEYDSVFLLNTDDDVNRLNDTVDIFVAGGDQIWNPNVLELVHLLSVAKEDKLKISYGSSVGVRNIPEDFLATYQKYLSRLSSISVREQQSKAALADIIEKKIDVVLDPTLLFDAKGWCFLTDEANMDKAFFKDKYILCYFIGKRNTYWNYVEKIKTATGYHVVVIPIHNEGFVNPYDKYVEVSPKEFLWMIQYAEIVCTDSFHATLFSVQYGKEFYTLKRFADDDKESQNGRLIDFLATLKLVDRLINDETVFERKPINTYGEIHEYLDKERKKSQEWLQQALKNQI